MTVKLKAVVNEAERRFKKKIYHDDHGQKWAYNCADSAQDAICNLTLSERIDLLAQAVDKRILKADYEENFLAPTSLDYAVETYLIGVIKISLKKRRGIKKLEKERIEQYGGDEI